MDERASAHRGVALLVSDCSSVDYIAVLRPRRTQARP
jgi:hypothetical protein